VTKLFLGILATLTGISVYFAHRYKQHQQEVKQMVNPWQKHQESEHKFAEEYAAWLKEQKNLAESAAEHWAVGRGFGKNRSTWDAEDEAEVSAFIAGWLECARRPRSEEGGK
jgi:hypothetical protein